MDEQRKKRLIAKYSKSSAKMPGGSGGPGGPGGPRPGPGGGKMKVKKPQDTKKAIARLMGYLSEDKGRLIFVFFCVIAGTIANLAGSYMLRPIINGLSRGGQQCTEASAFASDHGRNLYHRCHSTVSAAADYDRCFPGCTGKNPKRFICENAAFAGSVL